MRGGLVHQPCGCAPIPVLHCKLWCCCAPLDIKQSPRPPRPPRAAPAAANVLGISASDAGEQAVRSDFQGPLGSGVIRLLDDAESTGGLSRLVRRDGADDESRMFVTGTGEGCGARVAGGGALHAWPRPLSRVECRNGVTGC